MTARPSLLAAADRLDVEKCRDVLALSMNYEVLSDDKAHLISLLSDQLRAALTLLAEAREALKQFGEHHVDCSCIRDEALIGSYPDASLPCNCGFRAAWENIPDLSELKP